MAIVQSIVFSSFDWLR